MRSLKQSALSVLIGIVVFGTAGAQAQTNLSYPAPAQTTINYPSGPGSGVYGAITGITLTWRGLDRWDAIYGEQGEGSGSVVVWHETGRAGNQINFQGTCWNSSGCMIDASGWMTPTHQYFFYYGYHNDAFAGPYNADGNNAWPPLVANVGGVANLTGSSATFNGWLDSTGSAATAVSVYWGATDRGKTTAGWDAVVNFGVRTQGEYVSTSVSGLNPSTTYYYRFYGTNSAGASWSDPAVQFKPASTPTINNGAAADVQCAGARLTGTLAAGGNANVTVYWGTTDGGTTPSSWQHANNLGALGEGAFSSSIAGLTSGTTYYFRSCAANAAGTSWASSTANFQSMPDVPNAWICRMKITLSGYNKSETLTNFPALVVLNQSISGFQYSQFKTSGGGDLRFLDANLIEIPYEIESWNPSGNSYVWVNVPQMANSNSYVWAFWNMTGAVAPAYTTNGATWTKCVAVWHMNQASALDSSGNGNNGSASGTVTTVSSSLTGGADQFGGSGYVCVPESLTTRSHTNGLTTSFWLQNDLGGYALSRIGYVPYPSNVSPLAIPHTGFAEQGGNWVMGQGAAPASVGYMGVGSGRSDSSSTWHQYALVFDGVNQLPSWSAFPHTYGVMHAYKDGVWIGDDPGNSGYATTTFGACYGDADSLCLGANNLDFSGKLNGTMDEVRMENAIRSANWMWASYMTMAANAAFSSYAPVQVLSAPAVNNGSGAANIGTLSARLAGNLSSGGSASMIAYWGTTDGGTTPASWQHATSIGGVAQGAFGYDLSGLTPAMQYYYRYYATNACGSAWAGSSASFQTLPMPYDAWSCRMKMTFSGCTPGQPLTNFPALVVFGTNLSNFAYSQFASPNGYDLRFVDATGMTTLNYDFDKWNTNGQSFVWVQVPVLQSSSDYIWAYWGNPAATTQQICTTNGSVWDSNFKAVWHLGANTPNVADSTANHVNGTPYSDTNAVGIADGAQGFNGSAYVDLGNTLAPGSGFTLESWVASSGSGPIIKRRNPYPGATENLGYDLEMGSQPSISLWSEAAQTTKTAASGTGGFNDSHWHHVAGMWDGGNLFIYVDGILRGSLGGVSAPRDGSAVNIARDAWTYTGLTALLDEMRFSSIARSSNWVLATYMTVAANSTFSSYSVQVGTPPAIPAAPSGLTATAAGSGQINLAWTDNSTNEIGFVIERKTGSGGTYAQIAAVGANVTTYNDTGLSPSTTYYYRLRADNAGGYSDYSNEANATTQVPSIAAALSGLTATPVSTSQINLSWTDNSNNEDNFLIERKTGSGGTYAQIASVGANVTTYNDTGLNASTVYYYRVRAANAGGNSGYCTEANATTQSPPSVPAAPSGLTATTASSSQINLSWTDNSSNETGFKIERKTGSGGTYTQIATVGANATTYSDTGLGSSTTYYYRIRATNAGGDSGYSNEAYDTTQSSGALVINFNGTWYSSPYTVGASTYTMSGLQLQGTSATLNQPAGTVTVSGQLKMDYGGGTVTYNLSGGSLSVNNGQPLWLDAVAGMTALIQVSGSAQFTFGGGDAYFGNWGGGGGATLDVSGSSTVTYTGGQFEMGTGNSYINVTGGGATINLVNVRTDGHSIGGLTFTLDGSANHISPIVTTAGDFDLSGSSGTVHIITSGFSQTLGQTFDLIKIPQAGTIFVPGAGANALLNADSTANWSLSVVTAVGGYDILRATALTSGAGGTSPNAPSGLTATAAGASQINLGWTDNSTNETSFLIERKTGSGGTYVQIATVGANVTTYNDTGLSASTVYYYRVRASNGVGDSGYSNEANATTQAGSTAADWPCYRGPNKDGSTAETIASWPPREVWRASIGQGFSQVVVSGGKVYTMGWSNGQDQVYCFSAASTGVNPPVLWQASYAASPNGQNSDWGTRSTPTVDGNEVYTFSCDGVLNCYSKTTGTLNWSRMVTNGLPGYGFGSSPLIEGSNVIVNAGGAGIAIDKSGTRTNWTSSGSAGYASPFAVTVGAQRTVVVHAAGKYSGVDPASGAILWYFNFSDTYPTTDALISNNKMWVGGAGEAVVNLGSGQLLMDNEAGEWQTGYASGENCSVLYGGYVYGPSQQTYVYPAGYVGGGIQCVELATGNLVWNTSTSDFDAFSSVILAGNQLVMMSGSSGGGVNGNLVVAQATPTGYQEVYRTNGVLPGETWTCPTLSNGKLYVRNNTTTANTPATLICYDVSGGGSSSGIPPTNWINQYYPGTNSYASAATSDTDGDGMTAWEEYLAGTDPTSRGSSLAVAITNVAGQIVVRIPSIIATGANYTNVTRYYDIEQCTNLLTGASWQPVPGCIGVSANGGFITCTNASQDQAKFYRARVRLQ